MIELELNNDILAEAQRIQKGLSEINFKSTRALSDKRDLLGYIGQVSVIRQMEEWGFQPVYDEYYNDELSGDECDFLWRYEKCDVKTSPLKFEVYPKTRLLVMDEDEKKVVDRYVFVKVGIEQKKVIIIGTVNYFKFWRITEPFISDRVKAPCHYIFAKDLESFRDFVYAKS